MEVEPDLADRDHSGAPEGGLDGTFQSVIESARVVRVDTDCRDDGPRVVLGEDAGQLQVVSPGGWHEDSLDVLRRGAVERGLDLSVVKHRQVRVRVNPHHGVGQLRVQRDGCGAGQ